MHAMHIHHFRKEWKRNRTLFLMVAPAILLVLFLNYLPIMYD